MALLCDTENVTLLSDVAIEALVVSCPPLVKEMILKDKSIITVRDFISNCPENINELWPSVDKYIAKIIRWRLKHREPNIFTFQQCPDSALTDQMNMGSVLLLTGPATDKVYSKIANKISNLWMEEIKHYLGLCVPGGERNETNFLAYKLGNMDIESVAILAEFVAMYVEQVNRQADLTDLREINLFTFQQLEKQEAVTAMYPEIMAYLLTNSPNGFVWGELSDRQKDEYWLSITSPLTNPTRIKKEMITIIANYTLLPELEDEVARCNYKSLNRFIRNKLNN